MDRLTPPFVRIDGHDVRAFSDAEAMYADIEAYDAPKTEFFDSTGRPFGVVVHGFAWSIDHDRVGPPEPDRLIPILRGYFAALPKELSAYAARAEAASNLDDLVRWRLELADEPEPGRWARLFRRSWG